MPTFVHIIIVLFISLFHPYAYSELNPEHKKVLAIVIDAHVGNLPGDFHPNQLTDLDIEQKLAQLSDYYWRASHHAIDLAVVPQSKIVRLSIGTIQGDNIDICQDYPGFVSGLNQQLNQQLTEQGLTRSDYDFELYLLPQSADFVCPASGYADQGSISAKRNGRWSVLFSHNPMIWAHEMGHNFGLRHAGVDNDGDGSSDGAYGDDSSPMGSPDGWVSFNAPDQASLGWLAQQQPGAVQNINASGVYTLHALSGEWPFKGQQQVLKFDKYHIDDSDVELFLSYRPQVGLDSQLHSNYSQGLQLHQAVDAQASGNNAGATLLYRHFANQQDSYPVDLLSTINFSNFDLKPYLNHQGFTVITEEKTADYIKFHLLFDQELAGEVPYITRQPGENFSLAGFGSHFSVEVYSNSPVSYQWFYQQQLSAAKQAVTGAVTERVEISNINASKQGFYSVEVTNANGTVSSVAGYLDVFAAPTISYQPQNQTVSLGAPILLRLHSPQSPQGIVKWYRNGSLMHQGYESQFTIDSAEVTHHGQWHATINNGIGQISSDMFTVTVIKPLNINNQAELEQPHIAILGKDFKLTVDASSNHNSPISYQWYKNGAVMANQTNASLTFTTTQWYDEAIYSVEVAAGELSETVHGIVIQTQYGLTYNGPQNQQLNLYQNTPLYLAFTVAGTPAANYQWFKDGQLIATNTTVYMVPMVQADDGGVYSVRIFNTVEDFTVTLATVNVLGW